MPTARRSEKATTEARLLGLASYILSQGEPVTRSQIYAAFPQDYGGKADAAERKFSRDKDALRRLGFHLEAEPLGSDDAGTTNVGYAIDARACALPAIEFTPEEAAQVWTAGAAALRFSVHPLRDELESALRKLVVGAKGLPPPRAVATETLAAEGRMAGDRSLAKVLDGVIDAWERRKRITLDYWRVATGEITRRDVDVYGWAQRRGEWILVGFCHLRKGVRIFYLSRVKRLKVNGRPLAERKHRAGDYDIPDDFDVRRWSRQQIWDYDVHPPRPAAVRFTGSLARLAKQLLPTAKIEPEMPRDASASSKEAGARIARLEVRNLRGLVRQALAWGPEAELLEPEDARELAREILAGVVAWRAP
jgi:predicted DNA-binding transcriptional regulator YafY